MTCRDPPLTSHWPPRTTHWPPMTPHWPLRTPHWPPMTPTDLTWPPIDLPWSPMSFSFSVLFLFFPENSTPRDAHCCWQWASKKWGGNHNHHHHYHSLHRHADKILAGQIPGVVPGGNLVGTCKTWSSPTNGGYRSHIHLLDVDRPIIKILILSLSI